MPVSGSGAVVCSWSLLFAAIIAGVRQKLHLSTCSNLRGRLCAQYLIIAIITFYRSNGLFMRRPFSGVVALAALFGLVTPSAATIVDITYTGTVTSFTDGLGLFKGTVIKDGESFVASYVFNTSLGYE